MSKLFILRFAAILGTTCAVWAQAPAIAPDGIVDAASRMPPSLPGGKLAPGSKIRVPGIRLADTGSSTVIHVETGPWRRAIRPDFSSAELLEATLPPDTPAGLVKVWVSNGLGSSRPQEIRVEASHPAFFTLNGEGWGPALRNTVRPGDQVSLPVNGLNGKSPKVFVAGREAQVRQIGAGDVTFTVPKDSPAGCWTPVWMESASGIPSNFVSVPVSSTGGPCEEAAGWPLRTTVSGKRFALVTLQRFGIDAEFTPGHPVKFGYESGSVSLFRAVAGKLLPYQIVPPAGTCTAFSGTFLFANLRFFENMLGFRDFLGGDNAPLESTADVQIYQDGADQAQGRRLPGVGKGENSGLLGGFSPAAVLPQFLHPGIYHAAVEGSGERGGLRLSFEVGPPLEWTNGSPVTEVDRSRGSLVQWREPTPGRQTALIAFSADQLTGAAGVAWCLAAPGDSQMRIPSYALANLPATRTPANLPLRFLILISMPASAQVLPPTKGLDEVRAGFLDIHVTSVTFR